MQDRNSRIEVDARGLLCPLPILRLAKALDAQPDWAAAILRATDPDAIADVEAFCAERALSLHRVERIAGEMRFEIRRR